MVILLITIANITALKPHLSFIICERHVFMHYSELVNHGTEHDSFMLFHASTGF